MADYDEEVLDLVGGYEGDEGGGDDGDGGGAYGPDVGDYDDGVGVADSTDADGSQLLDGNGDGAGNDGGRASPSSLL